MGGDRGDAQGPDGIPPYSGKTDHGDDRETWGRRRVVLSSGRRGNGLRWDPPHQSIHKEARDNHIGEGVLPACIFTVRRGVENDGDKPYGVVVGSRRGKRAGGINEEEVYLINLTK